MSRYDWDAEKDRVNLAKHGVSFEEAETVMRSALARLQLDLPHSAAERRERVTGWSFRGRLLTVVVSVSGPRPRIISARRATKRERHAYEDRT